MATGETWRTVIRALLTLINSAVLIAAVFGPTVWTYTHPHTVDTQAAMLTGWDDPKVTRHTGEPTVGYVTRANNAATAAWAHCDRSTGQTWDTAAADKLSDAFDAEGTVIPADFYCGFCGQHAIMLARILRANGVDADAYLLNGHTVVQFTDNGDTYAVDPDVGVPPFRVDQPHLAATVHAAYNDYATYHDTGARPFPQNTADTAVNLYTTKQGDGPYPRDYYEALVDRQEDLLWCIHAGRWTLAAAAAAALVATLRQRGRTQKR